MLYKKMGYFMGKYSVPENIRKMKPKGTMVKNISNHYYVYEYKTITDENGKRRTKMGKVIGSIKEGIGFIPNQNFEIEEEISSLDYGEYAVALANSEDILSLLKECFNPQDAVTIYTAALIHAVNGFTHLSDIHKYFEMSVLSLKYPTLKLGYNTLSKLYDALGRRQGKVLEFERKLVEKCSGEIAVDGHAIGSVSDENALSEKGYRFGKLGEEQINLLMAYDVNTNTPLLTRAYEGAALGKISVQDFVQQVELKNMLFIVDRGFYSAENLNLFSQKNNKFIIPLCSSNSYYRASAVNLEFTDRFIYRNGKKAAVIEFKDEIISGQRIIAYRDLNKLAAEEENYLRHLEQCDKSYSKEDFEKSRKFMGVMIFQTNLSDKTPKQIYELYCKRWKIETFYNYFKNKADYNALHLGDYYKTQGLAFIMLAASLIRRNLENAAKNTDLKYAQNCLLEARMVKVHKRSGEWVICNCLKKRIKLFEQLNTPIQAALPEHT